MAPDSPSFGAPARFLALVEVAAAAADAKQGNEALEAAVMGEADGADAVG